MKNLTFNQVDYTALETVTKRCIRYKDGNTLVKPYKKLYRLLDVLEAMDGDLSLLGEDADWLENSNRYYLGIVPKQYGAPDLQLWIDFGPICYGFCWTQGCFTVSDFADSWKRFTGAKSWEDYRRSVLEKCKSDPSALSNYIRLEDVEIFRMMYDSELPTVEAHKAQVDEARINRYRREQQEREQRVKEAEQQEAAARQERLEAARNLLREHKPLENKTYSGTCLITELFEADGLKIPARTKRWMLDNLGRVSFWENGDAWESICWQRANSARSETFCRLWNAWLEKLENP